MLQKFILLAAMGILCMLYLWLACSPAPRRPGTGTLPVLDETEVTELLKTPSVKELTSAMEKLRPLHQTISPPGPSDWLANHEEPGQTFKEYLASDPVRPTEERNTIYIQPLGEFTETQQKIVTLTAEFIGIYYNLPVKVGEKLPLSLVPEDMRRIGPLGLEQVRTGYVLDKILRPRLPDNAVAYIAFTASDLWPGPGWNFVFGQASLRYRVGVWSICRFGDPAASDAQFKKTLLRTLKTGTHELGHMFSMYHCTLYECNMCGSNHSEESDRRPVWLCPECVAKACWATGAQPAARYEKLAEFCKANGFAAEQAFYEKSVKELGSK